MIGSLSVNISAFSHYRYLATYMTFIGIPRENIIFQLVVLRLAVADSPGNSLFLVGCVGLAPFGSSPGLLCSNSGHGQPPSADSASVSPRVIGAGLTEMDEPPYQRSSIVGPVDISLARL